MYKFVAAWMLVDKNTDVIPKDSMQVHMVKRLPLYRNKSPEKINRELPKSSHAHVGGISMRIVPVRKSSESTGPACL